jgi:hypothetical protein
MVWGSPVSAVQSSTRAELDVDEVLARAEALVATGRRDDAIELLTAWNPDDRPADVARRILQLRHDAYFELADRPGRPTWPPVYGDLFVDLPPGRIPEVDHSELSAAVLGGAVLHRGSLLVRGLVDERSVERLVAHIDRALVAARAWLDGATPERTAPWFELFTPSEPFSVGLSRRFVVQGGGVLGPDSPLAMCAVIDVLTAAGIGSILREYLGERPALSAKKTTLRRVPPDSGSDWHQDGAFLGADVRSLNVWLALSDCGVDAPGLDVVPRRLDLVETGTDGAIFDWSVGAPVVERAAGSGGVVRPVFRAGDALLFDERNLHATACSPAMTADRYAVEAWFFAPSTYPSDQVPLVF